MENKLEEANRERDRLQGEVHDTEQTMATSFVSKDVHDSQMESQFEIHNLSIRKLTHELDDVKDKLKGAQERIQKNVAKDAELQSVVARLQAKNGDSDATIKELRSTLSSKEEQLVQLRLQREEWKSKYMGEEHKSESLATHLHDVVGYMAGYKMTYRAPCSRHLPQPTLV